MLWILNKGDSPYLAIRGKQGGTWMHLFFSLSSPDFFTSSECFGFTYTSAGVCKNIDTGDSPYV